MKGPLFAIGAAFARFQDVSFFKSFQNRAPWAQSPREILLRLASDRMAASTLVATGTGSGKTECSLYPLLDHCASQAAGEGRPRRW